MPEGMAGGEAGVADSASTWRTYVGFGRSMETLPSALDLDGVGPVAPVEDPVWTDIRGFEGSPEGTKP